MAKDQIHETVKETLILDGWTITDDPFRIELTADKNRSLQIDLGAERVIAATKENEEIVVEIKTFGGLSVLNDFHSALGQYLTYQEALKEENIERVLFLAVSNKTYLRIMKLNFLQNLIKTFKIKFIVVNLATKKIESWIK